VTKWIKTLSPLWVVALLGAVLIWYFGTGAHQQLMTLVFIWATFALGWNIISGYGGQLSAGHAMFFGIGAFVPTLLFRWYGLTPALGIFVGVVLAVVAALIIGWPTFRLAGVYFTLATLAYPLMMIPLMDWLGFQEVSLPFIRENAAWYFQFQSPRGASWLALALLLVAVAVAIAVDRSRLGLALRAVKDNQPAAEAAGVDTFGTKMRAIALSAGLASAAGTLYTTSVLFVVTPFSVFGLLVSVNALIIAFVGGAGTVWGPLVGASLLIPLADVLTERYGATYPGLNGVLLGSALILTILFAPNGIYGRLRDVYLEQRRKRTAPEAAGGTAVGPDQIATEPSPEVAPTGVAAVSGGVSVVGGAARARHGYAGSGEVVLRTQNLVRRYGGLRAVDDVTIEVRDGELLGIIGPNGAGKTTLFDVMNGLVPPSSGQVLVRGQDITGIKPHKVCRMGVGRTFQVVRSFHDMSLIDNVRVGALFKESSSGHAQEAATRALGRVGLERIAERPVAGLNIADLRRMEFARALVAEPSILLADEPLAGLSGDDVRVVVDLLRRVRESGTTVVVIEHTMSAMVQLVDRFVVLDHGRVIADGPPAEIVKDDRVIEAYLGSKWANRDHAAR
jgi:ABC-type branched-subunit amino acid transport system ATPase component/ABC-type branched-subunit amino acid transport system permease subunit